ncbi:MAG: hypothetical protein CMN80_00440 [Spongiibacter sp.]|uniref:hypothetical protein n=1 Tax=Spongiibacter sp. TaxID=2024860 RepID=UPI000C0900DC|nr:hypothetical protein [Spongiibacter sp.]MAK42609.1 hypothetical protein [Spongiibacter sp.]|tara:strand:+ start:1141 stop:2097 length:957 start_codon:yes stop_codon:yes gene_type:complete
MEAELKEIASAINELSTVNPVKDYIFPLAIVLIGGLVAHFSAAYLRYLDAQKEKLDIANDWILGMQQAFNSLMAIKGNYFGKLTDAPLQRAGAFPEVIGSSQTIDLKMNKLSFIVQPLEEFSEEDNFHMNPAYISGLQHNYNLLINMLQRRNMLAAQIIPTLGQHYSTRGVHLDLELEQIYQVIPPSEFLGYVQLTEQIIKSTDELLIAIHNFLCQFPDICKLSIDTQRIKHYRKVVEIYYDRMDLLENSPTVNYGALAKLFRVTEEEVRERFSTGYENQPVPIEKTTESLKNPGVDDAIKKHKLNDSIKKRHRYWWV